MERVRYVDINHFQSSKINYSVQLNLKLTQLILILLSIYYRYISAKSKKTVAVAVALSNRQEEKIGIQQISEKLYQGY